MPVSRTGSGSVLLRVSGEYKKSGASLQDIVTQFVLHLDQAFSGGTGSNQFDRVYKRDGQSNGLLDATGVTLDLAGDTGFDDAVGDDLTFAKVRLIALKNKATGAGEDILLGGAAANQLATLVGAADDRVRVKPGGLLLLVAPGEGYTVTAGTGDQLKLAAATGTLDYELLILGTSA